MRFVIDLDSLYLIESATDRRPVSSVTAKRGDDAPFEVIFVRSGVAEELADSIVLTFGAKQDGKYDGTAVVLEDGFTLSGTGNSAKYLGNPSFNTVGLNALFAIDGVDTNDVPYVDLMAEFTWKTDSSAPTSTKTFRFRVHNDVIRGTEGTPLADPDPDEWLIARVGAQIRSTAEGAPDNAGLLVTDGGDVNGFYNHFGTYDGAEVLYSPTASHYLWYSGENDKWYFSGSFDPDEGGGTPTVQALSAGHESYLDVPAWSDQPDMALVEVTASVPRYIGDQCRVGDAEPYDWYDAPTLTTWRLRGALWNATQALWQKLTITGAAGAEQINIVTL